MTTAGIKRALEITWMIDWLIDFSRFIVGVGMRLTDVGIATCKKGWVLQNKYNTKPDGLNHLCVYCASQTTCNVSFLVCSLDTRGSRETVPRHSLISSKPCICATSTVRSLDSSLYSQNPKRLWSLNPSQLNLSQRLKRLSDPPWRANPDKRGAFTFKYCLIQIIIYFTREAW